MRSARDELTTTNQQLEETNATLQRTALQAQTNFRKTQEVVDRFLTDVSESQELLRGTAGTQRLRQKLLEMARDYYEGFVSDNKSMSLDRDLAIASSHLGFALQELGEFKAATKQYTLDVEELW